MYVDEGYDFIFRYYMWGMRIVEFDCWLIESEVVENKKTGWKLKASGNVMKIECNKKVECRGVDILSALLYCWVSFQSWVDRSSYEDFEFAILIG